ncbi:MAG: hypothetical protein AAFX01_14130 [Cyanobacteria bacterium J06638_28]
MQHPYSRSWFFRFATRALKYFLLGLAGCTVAYCFSLGLGFSALANLLVALLEGTLSRLLVIVLCLGAIAVITESMRN